MPVFCLVEGRTLEISQEVKLKDGTLNYARKLGVLAASGPRTQRMASKSKRIAKNTVAECSCFALCSAPLYCTCYRVITDLKLLHELVTFFILRCYYRSGLGTC